jgi:mannose-6-phosphate isomerase-like protein (cupin superfamily)
MSIGDTKTLSSIPDVLAPDGSEVRLLAKITNGSMAEFRLQPGQVTTAVAHRTIEELWYVTHGTGQIWRKSPTEESIQKLQAGTSISIPTGVAFQFRNDGDIELRIIGATMPPWPGADEAYIVEGKW